MRIVFAKEMHLHCEHACFAAKMHVSLRNCVFHREQSFPAELSRERAAPKGGGRDLRRDLRPLDAEPLGLVAAVPIPPGFELF